MTDGTAAGEPEIGLGDKLLFWGGVVLAVWLILVVFLFDPTPALFWSNIASGALLLALGAANFRRYRNGRPIRGTVLVAQVLLGGWVMGSPVVFDALAEAGGLITWTSILPGMLIVFSAGVEAVLRSK